MPRKNESGFDRTLRALAGVMLVLAGLFLFGGSSGSLLGLAVAVIGTLILVTAATGFCILYWLGGVSTLSPGSVRAERRGEQRGGNRT